MKRRTRQWGRILFNTLTAISLLLAIATAGLWGVSYPRVIYYWDRSTTPIPGGGWTRERKVRITSGALLIELEQGRYYDGPSISIESQGWGWTAQQPAWEWMSLRRDFRFRHTPYPYDGWGGEGCMDP